MVHADATPRALLGQQDAGGSYLEFRLHDHDLYIGTIAFMAGQGGDNQRAQRALVALTKVYFLIPSDAVLVDLSDAMLDMALQAASAIPEEPGAQEEQWRTRR
jgi:hypothetical protein